MIKYAAMNEYDGEEFQDFIIKFHEGEYMTSYMEAYGLQRIFPSEYDLFYDQANENANIIISEFIREITEWIDLHDEENPEIFFRARYNQFLDELEDTDTQLGDILGQERWGGPSFNTVSIDQISQYLGSKEDFLDFWYRQTSGYSANQVWDEEVDYHYRDMIMDENPDIDENELEEKLDELRENPDYDSMMEQVKEHISAMTSSDSNMYGRREPIDHPIDAYTFYSSEPVTKAMEQWWISTGMHETVMRWEEGRASGEGLWVQNTTNFDQVEKAKEGLKRLIESQNKSVKEKAVAITLALNLQHNAGNLLKDHLEVNVEFLDQLDQWDTSEWEANIDSMIARTGKNKDELYQEEQLKMKHEKYLRERTNDLWQWKADRERFGRLKWYMKVKSANRVGRLNIGLLRAIKMSS